MRLRQPAAGIVATAAVVVVSLAFIAAFPWPVLRDWVSYGLVCTIPFAFVVGAFWHGEHPRRLGALRQPWRGLAFLAMALAVGVVVALVEWATIGGRVTPPTVMVAQCVIISVPISFFLAVVWGGWPFTRIRRPLLGGLALLVTTYALTDAVFLLAFDYGAMQGTPAYVAELDPAGRFEAWTVLVAIVTAMAAALVVAHLELWPMSRRESLLRQPVLGLCWTAIAVVITAVVVAVGTGPAGMSAPQLLTTVTAPFLFGSIIVLTMLEHTAPPRHWRQPWRGLASATLAALVGVALARIYVALSSTTSGDIAWGAPGFDGEVWLASALLAVTFPFLAFHADFFGLWPYRADDPAGQDDEHASPHHSQRG